MAWHERVRSRLRDLARWGAARRRPLLVGAAVFVASAVAFHLAHAAAHYWGIDDAGVTYAYSLQLADHHSLAPYLGGPPVEGYSNPLLFFLVALLRLLGWFDPITTHVRLEPLVFAVMVTLAWDVCRMWAGEAAALIATLIFASLELLVPATWVWYSSGLENVWLSAGIVLLVWIFARTARGAPLSSGWGNAAFVVAIIRPEAPVYVAGFYLAVFAFARPETLTWVEHARRVCRPLVVTAALYVAFLLWRHHTYGEWLPNTYYAKLSHPVSLRDNLRAVVFGQLFPYCASGLFAAALLALLVAPRMERLASGLAVFLLASLALPLTAGADFMGEHRFGTPFFLVSHFVYAVLVAVCVARLVAQPPRRWRAAHVLAVGAALVLPARLAFDHLAIVDHITLSDVSIARVAYLQGGQRWEHQMRLGVPDAVVMMPDAGGSLLVGSMQMVDSGYLTDFQTPRLGRDLSDPIQRRLLDQYELVERRPDLVDDNHNFIVDRDVLAQQYRAGPGRLLARRDLVELPAIPQGARLVWRSPALEIYLSPSTVLTAAPRGLVRCELIVAWHGAPQRPAPIVRATVGEHGDRDEIVLDPYEAKPDGIERRALLLGAPDRPGSVPVALEVIAPDGATASAGTLALDVTRDDAELQRATDQILQESDAGGAAFRIAWLREQSIPRLDTMHFRVTMSALAKAFAANNQKAGSYIMRLRWNARLAQLEHVPPPIRAAELVAARRVLATCPAAGTDPAQRIACIGQAIDQLRRLGYLHVLERVPEVTRELRAARARLDRLPLAEQYEVLFGLVRADPGTIDLQRRLLDVRARIGTRASLPELPAMTVR